MLTESSTRNQVVGTLKALLMCVIALDFLGVRCYGEQDRCDAFYGLRIVSGIADYQVLQRNENNQGSITIRGQAFPFQGNPVLWRVVRRRQTVRGLDWQPAQVTSEGHWQAVIERLPTGGPYTIDFRLTDCDGHVLAERQVVDILVGDLWFMGGQSNMAGSGPMSDVEMPSEMVHVYSLANEWQVAEDPLHVCSEAVLAVYRTSYVSPTQRRAVPYKRRSQLPEPTIGSGLGVTFGKVIYEHSKVPVGLIAGALGGTTMDQWNPGLRDKEEDSLYWAMLKRIGDQGGRIKGILWWQGESDIYNATVGIAYESKFREFILKVRQDLNVPDLPFYAVQLSFHGEGLEDEQSFTWNLVQDAQRRVVTEVTQAGLVASLDQPKIDAHLTSNGYQSVGRRLARLVLSEVYAVDTFETGPRLTGMSLFQSRHGDGIRLSFDGVNGRLLASPRVSGFSIRRKDGTKNKIYINNVEVDPNRLTDILIHTGIRLGEFPEGLNLWYGWGSAPLCNVTDEQGMALPMFGPIPLRIE